MKGFLGAFFVFLFWAAGGVYYIHLKESNSEEKNQEANLTEELNVVSVPLVVTDNKPTEVIFTDSLSVNDALLKQEIEEETRDSILFNAGSITNSQLLADELKKSIAISDTIDISKDEPTIDFNEEINTEIGPAVSSSIFYPRYSNSSDLILDKKLVTYASDLKKLLKENPDKKVTIIGHTDNVGNGKDNFAIGLKKSRQIKWYLTARRGIPRYKVTATSRGEEEPVESNKTNWGRRKNNRIEIIVD